MNDVDFMRATALALRDLAEGAGAVEAQFTFETGDVLTWSADDGYHLLDADGTTDLTEWVDHVDFVPVEGVESVTEQPALLAKGAQCPS